ncbi:caspase a-like [Limanda limanda]|uniref:caspase a-like n=1 Tax=Limanda limanda TaxID=27771 RepID=UPI0029C90EBA|nr:caspase a-like [Limanda limanda]
MWTTVPLAKVMLRFEEIIFKEEGGSTTLIPTTEDFWRNKQNKKDIYPVTKDNYRNQTPLLFTNIKFTLEGKDRHGAEKDEENAEKLVTDLGYEVVKYTNLTAKAIDEALIQFSEHPKLQGTDSVMVILMSHGKPDTILGVDWCRTSDEPDQFPINDIYKHLGPEKCPALLNKPKIIIIGACRGDEKGAVLVSHSAAGPDKPGLSPDSQLTLEHREKDVISLLSSTPGTVAYRDTVRGSLLIQAIVKIFNTHAFENDIAQLFQKVMQRFEEFCPSNIRQMPTKDRCTLTKRFYFYPGLNLV